MEREELSSLSPTAKGIIRFFVVLAFTLAATQGLSAICNIYLPHGGQDFFLHWVAFYAVALQVVVFFIHASGLLFGNERTERYYDFTGACTFFTAAIMSLAHLHYLDTASKQVISDRQRFLTAAVLMWCSRLGLFLYSRIQAEGGIDSRFVEIKKVLLRFLSAWLLQGTWVFLTSLPVFLLNMYADDFKHSLGVRDYVGMAMWLVGFVTEVVADAQKTSFNANKDNHGKRFINTGLWALSRHPNYFGEILLWAGVCTSATSHMPLPLQIVSFVASPLFIAALIINVSGIALLEDKANKKWGGDKKYQEYKENTPVLIPFVGRKGDKPW